jgi:hypothetical protein
MDDFWAKTDGETCERGCYGPIKDSFIRVMIARGIDPGSRHDWASAEPGYCRCRACGVRVNEQFAKKQQEDQTAEDAEAKRAAEFVRKNQENVLK